MIYLLVCVLCSSLLYVLFKLFAAYRINTFQAIACNYLSAATLGFLLSESSPNGAEVVSKPWLWGAALLGLLFIAIFNVMAKTSQQNGLSVASVASKMSLIIPVTVGIVVYGESVGILKLVGILLAVVAVYFTSSKPVGQAGGSFLFPLILFFGAGTIDTLIKYMEQNFVPDSEVALFSATTFVFAALAGWIVLFFRKKYRINLRTLVAGVLLGIPNYFSIAFMMKGLETMESSVFFSINNVAIVALTTLVGLLFFQEKMWGKNWVGVALAMLSIFMIVS